LRGWAIVAALCDEQWMNEYDAEKRSILQRVYVVPGTSRYPGTGTIPYCLQQIYSTSLCTVINTKDPILFDRFLLLYYSRFKIALPRLAFFFSNDCIAHGELWVK
jgi:hypothetical protein